MPLLDHFRTPISPRFPWQSFSVVWSVHLAGCLNQQILPEKYLAQIRAQSSLRVETDVSAGEHDESSWKPPQSTQTLPTVFPDNFEV